MNNMCEVLSTEPNNGDNSKSYCYASALLPKNRLGGLLLGGRTHLPGESRSISERECQKGFITGFCVYVRFSGGLFRDFALCSRLDAIRKQEECCYCVYSSILFNW